MKKNNTKAQNFNEAMIDFFCENYVSGNMQEYAENTEAVIDFLHNFALCLPLNNADTQQIVLDCREHLFAALLAYKQLGRKAEQKGL